MGRMNDELRMMNGEWYFLVSLCLSGNCLNPQSVWYEQ